MKYIKFLFIISIFILNNGCNTTTQQNTNISKQKLPKDYYSPEEVDKYAYKLLDVNISDINSSNPIVGNWYGKAHYMQIALRLNNYGTYKYKSILELGKYHNEPRTTEYNGTWSIANSQIVLKLQNVDAPLVLTNNFPTLYSPAGINLYSGTEVNTSIKMDINQSQNNVTASYTQNAQDYMDRNVSDYGVSYFTMVAVKVMAEYLNNFDVQFDLLSFNYHPRSSHTTDEYKSAAKYFGAISKQLKIRKGNKPKLWIWKLSLWNQEQTSFIFSNIDFLVDDCNAIGVTLGHGNDLKGKTGFSDNPDNNIYIQSWIKEYFNGERNDNIPIHATPGLIYWR